MLLDITLLLLLGCVQYTSGCVRCEEANLQDALLQDMEHYKHIVEWENVVREKQIVVWGKRVVRSRGFVRQHDDEL
jgi:hypothetical protein